MSKQKIHNISSYLHAIDCVAAHYGELTGKTALIFRGLSDYRHTLVPSAYRSVCRQTSTGMVQVPCYGQSSEHEMLRHFIKNAMSVIDHIDKDDLLTWLTYAQHFGAPTRLLDFSANPLISLYFCCKREPGVDGAICVLYEKNYIHSLGLRSAAEHTKRDVLAEIMENIRDPKIPCTPYPVTLIPHYIDRRMEAQSSRFLVWGSDHSPFESIAVPYGDLAKGEDGAFFSKLCIDGLAKQNLLRELRFLGVSEKKLFPGLDGIGKYIAAYYRQDASPD